MLLIESIIDYYYLLWIFLQKNWTNFSLFSSWSSMNLEKYIFWWFLKPLSLSPGSCSLSKQFHQPSFHFEPNVSWKIEEEGKEGEIQGHPLVVGIVNNVLKHFILKQRLISSWKTGMNLNPNWHGFLLCSWNIIGILKLKRAHLTIFRVRLEWFDTHLN